MGNNNEGETKATKEEPVLAPTQGDGYSSPQRPAQLIKLSLGSGSKRSPEKPITKDEVCDLIPQLIQDAIERKGSPTVRLEGLYNSNSLKLEGYDRQSSDSPKGPWSKQKFWTGLKVMPTLQPQSLNASGFLSPQRLDSDSPGKSPEGLFDAECRKVFLQVDSNKDGFIKTSELVQGLFLINPEFAEEASAEALEQTLGELLQIYSEDSRFGWSLQAFMEFMHHFRQF